MYFSNALWHRHRKEAFPKDSTLGCLIEGRGRLLIFQFFSDPFLLYGVLLSALNIISSYMKQKQRTKINDCFSGRSNIKYDVPQSLILSLLVLMLI